MKKLDVCELAKAQEALRVLYNKRVYVTQKVAGNFGFEIYTKNKDKATVNGKPWIKEEGFWTLSFPTYEEALSEGINQAKLL